MAPQTIQFYSDGLRLTGYLHHPADWQAGDAPRPGIVVLAGYSGNTQADCTHMMKRLAAAGFFVLGFDYRGFGASEGTRGRHRPLEQAQDTHDALSYLQGVPGVDPERIAIYGTSFGGANGIWVTAFDERVKCLVATVPVTHGERWLRLVRRPWEWHAFKDRVTADARRRVRDGEALMVPKAEILVPDPDAARQREMHMAKGHVFQSEDRDLESAEATMRYRPEWVIDRISPRPVLMIYAERDNLVPPEEALSAFAACGEPKRLVRLDGCGHYDCYEFRNPVVAETVYRETIGWFRTYLEGAQAGGRGAD